MAPDAVDGERQPAQPVHKCLAVCDPPAHEYSVSGQPRDFLYGGSEKGQGGSLRAHRVSAPALSVASPSQRTQLTPSSLAQIALGRTIGTGLSVGVGGALAEGGPLGVVLGCKYLFWLDSWTPRAIADSPAAGHCRRLHGRYRLLDDGRSWKDDHAVPCVWFRHPLRRSLRGPELEDSPFVIVPGSRTRRHCSHACPQFAYILAFVSMAHKGATLAFSPLRS